MDGHDIRMAVCDVNETGGVQKTIESYTFKQCRTSSFYKIRLD
jgi:hypothetical protein